MYQCQIHHLFQIMYNEQLSLSEDTFICFSRHQGTFFSYSGTQCRITWQTWVQFFWADMFSKYSCNWRTFQWLNSDCEHSELCRSKYLLTIHAIRIPAYYISIIDTDPDWNLPTKNLMDWNSVQAFLVTQLVGTKCRHSCFSVYPIVCLWPTCKTDCFVSDSDLHLLWKSVRFNKFKFCFFKQTQLFAGCMLMFDLR